MYEQSRALWFIMQVESEKMLGRFSFLIPMDRPALETRTDFVWFVLNIAVVGGIDSFLYWKEKNVIVSRVAPLRTGDALSPQPQWWPDLLPWTHSVL